MVKLQEKGDAGSKPAVHPGRIRYVIARLPSLGRSSRIKILYNAKLYTYWFDLSSLLVHMLSKLMKGTQSTPRRNIITDDLDHSIYRNIPTQFMKRTTMTQHGVL